LGENRHGLVPAVTVTEANGTAVRDAALALLDEWHWGMNERSMAVTDLLFGRSLASDEEGKHRVGLWAGMPMPALDALGSAAYGPNGI